MEFVIKQSVLKEELGFVQGIVEKKTTIPVLSNILIESVGENTIRIVGTDLDVTIRCEALSRYQTSRARCASRRESFSTSSALLDGATCILQKRKTNGSKLTCGKSNFRLAGVSNATSFPKFRRLKARR